MVNEYKKWDGGPDFSKGYDANQNKKYSWKEYHDQPENYTDVFLENIFVAGEMAASKHQIIMGRFDDIDQLAHDHYSMVTRDLLSDYVKNQEVYSVDEERESLISTLVSIDKDLAAFRKRATKREEAARLRKCL